jgi:hypothetical protein
MSLKRVFNKIVKPFRIFLTQLYNEPIVYLSKGFRVIMLACLAISFIFFAFIVWKAFILIWDSPAKKLKDEIVTSLELLFLAPLPFIIISAFYFYYKKQIEPELNPNSFNKWAKINIINTNLTLSSAKLLFITTLISLLVTKILEAIDFHHLEFIESASWKSLIAFFSIIAILICYFVILEKSIHSVYKRLDEVDKDQKTEE